MGRRPSGKYRFDLEDVGGRLQPATYTISLSEACNEPSDRWQRYGLARICRRRQPEVVHSAASAAAMFPFAASRNVDLRGERP